MIEQPEPSLPQAYSNELQSRAMMHDEHVSIKLEF
jgi:hypothetical protein